MFHGFHVSLVRRRKFKSKLDHRHDCRVAIAVRRTGRFTFPPRRGRNQLCEVTSGLFICLFIYIHTHKVHSSNSSNRMRKSFTILQTTGTIKRILDHRQGDSYIFFLSLKINTQIKYISSRHIFELEK